MTTTEAQLRANKKYHDKFERIQVRVSPEEKEAIESHAEGIGESVNSFIRRAVAETMEREQSKK